MSKFETSSCPHPSNFMVKLLCSIHHKPRVVLTPIYCNLISRVISQAMIMEDLSSKQVLLAACRQKLPVHALQGCRNGQQEEQKQKGEGLQKFVHLLRQKITQSYIGCKTWKRSGHFLNNKTKSLLGGITEYHAVQICLIRITAAR